MTSAVRWMPAVVGAGIACFLGFWWTPHTLGITDLDEGLYAAAARNMAISGDWVTPSVNGTPFYEKPPLSFWLAAACIKAFGPSELAVRLPSAIAATLTLGAVFAFGRRRLGPEPAFVAVCALALAPLTVAAARLATTDALLVLLVTCSLAAAFRARELMGCASFRWSLAAFALTGLAMLAKGAAGSLTVLAVLLAYDLIVLRRGVRSILRSVLSVKALIGLVLLLAVAAPWHVAAFRADGSIFVDEYLMRQHVARFRGGDTAHHAPVWFYVPGFVMGFFPWSLFAIAGLLREDKRRLRTEQPNTGNHGDDGDAAARIQHTLGFLRCWFVVVILLFSVSGSKLVSYILPMYPAAALLAGRWLVRACSSRHAARKIALGAGTALACLAAVYAVLLHPGPVVSLINRYADRQVTLDRIDADALGLAAYLIGSVCIGLAASLVVAAIGRARWAPAVLAVTMGMFYAIVLTRGAPVAEERMIGSLHTMAREAGLLAGRDGGVVIAVRGPRRPSTLFYLPDAVISSRRVIESNPDADCIGLAAKSFPTVRYPSMRVVYVVTDADSLDKITRQEDTKDPTMTIIREAGKYVLVRIERTDGALQRARTAS